MIIAYETIVLPLNYTIFKKKNSKNIIKKKYKKY